MVTESAKPLADAPRGLRQQRADETRARLFTAAVELFRKDGYHKTSVESIAAKAGVAKGTFFVHYKSKDAVIAELVAIQTEAVREARRAALASGRGPLEALRASVLTLGEMASRSRSLSRGVLSAVLESQDAGGLASAMFEAVYEEMRSDATAAKNAGLLAAHASPETLAQSLMAAYLGSLLHFTSTPASKSKPLLETLTPLVDASLGGVMKLAFRGSDRQRPHERAPRRRPAPQKKR